MSTLFGKRKRKAISRSHVREGDDPRLASDASSDSRQEVKTIDEESDNKHEKTEQQPVAIDKKMIFSFRDMDLAEPLIDTCESLGLKRPTPVQAAVIPFLLSNSKDSVLAVAPTGTGKTVAYVLPMLHHLSFDPYGIFGLILTPTRELAKQIQEQIIALGSPTYHVSSCLAIGGLDATEQACQISRSPPHFLVATPGRLRILLQSADPPQLRRFCRYWVLDEADRLLVDDFETDLAAIALALGGEHDDSQCQRLFFSATMTHSLLELESIAETKTGVRSAQLVQFRLTERPRVADGTETQSNAVKIPTNLSQEYLFVPNRIREAYLLALLRSLLVNGGRREEDYLSNRKKRSRKKRKTTTEVPETPVETENGKSTSAIVFCSSCERAALISEMLLHVGVSNTPLHSILSQPRRLASVAKFRNGMVSVLVATDLGSRGLDIPATDLVINLELPPSAVTYVHRIGRTARAGRRGRAVSLVAETDVELVHAAEAAAGRELVACTDKVDVKPMLSVAAKAMRWAKLRLQDIGFDELLMKFRARKGKEKKIRDQRRRGRLLNSVANDR